VKAAKVAQSLGDQLTGGLQRAFDLAGMAAAFIVKDAAIALSYRLQFAFRFTQIFFSVAVVYFIGRMVEASGGSVALERYRGDYFSFALVGLVTSGYMRTGLMTVTNEVRQLMSQGTLEALCAAPVGYKALLLYGAVWPFLFEAVRCMFCLLVAVGVFGLRLDNAAWAGALATILLTVPVFLLLGLLSSSILVVVKRGDPINWIFTSAAALLAGTMFPVSVMPPWLQSLAFCLPLTHSLEAMRLCLLAGASVRQVQTHLLALLCFLVVLIPLTIVVSDACMRKAKRCGAFATH